MDEIRQYLDAVVVLLSIVAGGVFGRLLGPGTETTVRLFFALGVATLTATGMFWYVVQADVGAD